MLNLLAEPLESIRLYVERHIWISISCLSTLDRTTISTGIDMYLDKLEVSSHVVSPPPFSLQLLLFQLSAIHCLCVAF